ncbi:protein BASIC PENTACYSTEINE7-like isoform X2 [Juglans microcarpa x Juglans regia]|nr:protein BASIC PENTACYSTEINE7-like isoform X2 [Juglans microcarpa x Juglans regia]
MGTYSNRNPMIPEATAGASVPHFTWFYPGSFLSASKTSSNPFQGVQLNPQPNLPVGPIRTIAVTPEPVNDIDSATKPAKGGKLKNSVKGSNQVASKVFRPKQTKKTPKTTKGKSMPEGKREKKILNNIHMEKADFDFSRVPPPYCSCTGVARLCYKWGAGGWQSSCCTINISEYPLPMSSTRPGARVAGRKMSNGAYGKLLLRLAAEGCDLTHPVDLKDHWARHGTNKFVIIK